MLKALGLLGLNPWVLLAVGIGLAVSHGAVAVKSYNLASDRWEAKVAAAVAQAKAEQEARNEKTRQELEALVRAEKDITEKLTAELEDLNRVTENDDSDVSVTVNDGLDRVWSQTLGLDTP